MLLRVRQLRLHLLLWLRLLEVSDPLQRLEFFLLLQHLLRLRLVETLHMTDLHGQHGKADHFAKQSQLELQAIHPPRSAVTAVSFFGEQIHRCPRVARIGSERIPVGR